MIVLTADHYIGDVEGFHVALETAVELTFKEQLVTLAIKPSEPSTRAQMPYCDMITIFIVGDF
jgi:mannose-1-phosphate guanylyltransferase